jgi:hypothetical protein
MIAGATRPPSAAATGNSALRKLESCPTTSSRLISSPTTKKKRAISPSFTQCSADIAKDHRPTTTPSFTWSIRS